MFTATASWQDADGDAWQCTVSDPDYAIVVTRLRNKTPPHAQVTVSQASHVAPKQTTLDTQGDDDDDSTPSPPSKPRR